MQTIEEIQNSFMTAFNEIDDWMMQYEFLLRIGAELEPFPDDFKDDSHLIRGCQSKVWLKYTEKDGRIHILGDSEALIVKGMFAVAIIMFQDQTVEDVADAKVRYIEETSIKNQISTDRFQGLNSVIRAIQQYAEGCMKKEKKEQLKGEGA